MSGSDTSRGINFQYACALGLLLDFAEHPGWQIIQMEGGEDVEDVVIFGEDNQTPLCRAQIKQKQDPEQWRPNEVAPQLIVVCEVGCGKSDQT